MALKKYDKNSKTFDATQDHQLWIHVPSDFYNIQIFYSNFDGADNSSIKLQRTQVNPADLSKSFDVPDSSITITDSDGKIEYANQTPEKSEFLIINYTANGQDGAGAELEIWVNQN